MFDITFEKLYRYERKEEPCFLGLPVKKGEIMPDTLHQVMILQNGKPVRIQRKITAVHEDGSAKYIFLRFQADLEANRKTVLSCDFHSELPGDDTRDMMVIEGKNTIGVNTHKLAFEVENGSKHLFRNLHDGRKEYTSKQFVGPLFSESGKKALEPFFEKWSIVESGPVFTRLKGTGFYEGKKKICFEVFLNCYNFKEYLEVEYRLINTTEEELRVAFLHFGIKDEKRHDLNFRVTAEHNEEVSTEQCFSFSGIKKIPEAMEKYPVDKRRYTVGNSNYKTHFSVCGKGSSVARVADSELILKEGNEHYAEVIYGTFMADRTLKEDGVCATIYQAQQNYPKAVKVDDSGLMVMLVPEGIEQVIMRPGMSRNQKFLLHFHAPEESLIAIEDRSLIYQMPDRPIVAPHVYREAGVLMDLFVEEALADEDVEAALIAKGDSHSRCFGMLNWGDSPDPGYTSQNRGKGRPVWTNNEYDYPHACFLEYARTGVRRFLDYGMITAEHWMDVDVCHYSKDPLLMGGQWEHTARHTLDGTIVPSHSWVEGLLDYYHFTGNERALETAIGIGENVLRLLETDTYKQSGESNARETGWALRSLTALYLETYDEKWLKKADWIIGHFEEWAEKYGGWLAPYTDNTCIRVPFMIAVAMGSIMRYHRVFPSDRTKKLLIDAAEDLYESCLLPSGLFYYKELPSLNRNGTNTLVLEALCIGFELTGDVKYLKAGLKTFRKQIGAPAKGALGAKSVFEDAVIFAGDGTKGFAQSFIPLCTYYKTCKEQGIF